MVPGAPMSSVAHFERVIRGFDGLLKPLASRAMFASIGLILDKTLNLNHV
jgi:hypothetical protein